MIIFKTAIVAGIILSGMYTCSTNEVRLTINDENGSFSQTGSQRLHSEFLAAEPQTLSS